MGDGVLVEFASAVNAVQCAADLQQKMAEANTGLAQERAIVLRIGVNLGDVAVENGDLSWRGSKCCGSARGDCQPRYNLYLGHRL